MAYQIVGRLIVYQVQNAYWSERTNSHNGTETKSESKVELQWRILSTARKRDSSMLHVWRNIQVCKYSFISWDYDIFLKVNKKGPANLVPAAAVIRGDQVLGILTGHKELTDGAFEHLKKLFLNRYTLYKLITVLWVFWSWWNSRSRIEKRWYWRGPQKGRGMII